MKFKELTKPGFYWYRFSINTNWMVAFVESNKGDLQTRNFCGASVASPSNQGEYVGPIHPEPITKELEIMA